jgi:helicase
MNNIINLAESESTFPTSSFPYAKFPFDNFNKVQASLLSVVEKDCNILIATATSSGKTVMAEMFGSYELRKNNKKLLFLCPLRALANEKFYDWTNSSYHFSDLKIGIFTGDFKKDNKGDLSDLDIIIMTSEMLNHKLRSTSSKTDWIKNIGVICIDESHLLTVPGRGDHLESAIMNFSKINCNSRFVLLSATLPNVDEVASWIGKSINGKETYILKSTHRPCPLKIHFQKYEDQSVTNTTINELVDEVCNCAERYFTDKFLIFVHAKKIGEMIVEALARRNITARFHNANLDKDQRFDIEKDFRQNKNARILVATSTLAWGVNLAARRVIVAGVSRGNELVPSYDILQMIGRAGRPPYDTEGDAHIFLPESRSRELSKIVVAPTPITSKMLEVSNLDTYDILAFHILNEIASGIIKNKNDILTWYSKTLAHHQRQKINLERLENTITRMLKGGIISINDKEFFEITSLGKVSTLFYLNPFDLSNISRNFNKIFTQDYFDDIDISLALANTGSNIIGNLSKQDKIDMQKFIEKASKKSTKAFAENVMKIAFLYYKIINGKHEIRHYSLYKTLQNDMPRVIEALKLVDSMTKKWGQKDFFTVLSKRVVYGVPARLISLIEIKGIGKIRAEKLYAQGIRTKQDIINNLESTAKIAGLSQETIKKGLQ